MAASLDIPFPFTPYDIQKEFMRVLFEALEDGSFGILESPTGTVSLACTGTTTHNS